MGISIWQLLIILAIVLILFGAKRLRNVGSDLGASVKGFRDAMRDGEKKEEEEEEEDKKIEQQQQGRVIDAEVHNITRDVTEENRKS